MRLIISENINLLEARKCPDGLKNPFILLRIGQCCYELRQFEEAENYLLQAYMYEENEIFRGEPEKYYNLIKPLV